MSIDLDKLRLEIRAAAVFRGLLEDQVIKALITFLDTPGDDVRSKLSAYGDFAAALYKSGESLSGYIFGAVARDDNVYIRKIAAGECVPKELEDSVDFELKTFERLSRLTSEDLKLSFGYNGFLPSWKTNELDFLCEYRSRWQNVSKIGYGIYAEYHMFYYKNNKITPIKHPDTIALTDLFGYERERKRVVDNTRALLCGKPAANILLSGDAGTGKSSTVKAVANEFGAEGLRLLEIRKDQLTALPEIIRELHKNPLKFILFIDDLSFNQTDDNFSALKAILEGTVAAKSENVVIYATSNRRHIVKESFSDRDNGDDVHRNDTMQELLSLSERFGLCITFVKPNKDCFLNIVKNLALKNGLDMDEQSLFAAAERFALLKGGRSGRIAKQFVNSLLSS